MKIAERKVPVYQGRLMSPNEVRSAIYQRGGILPHEYQQSWYLCGDVTDEFFRRVERHEKITHSLNTFGVNGSTSFAVFSLQIREQQARFLLPFASEKSVRFVEQVERTGVFMSLGKAGTRDTLLLEFNDRQNQLKELRSVAKRCARLPCDLDLIEVRMASYSMTQVSAIPSVVQSESVSEVCLTVVLDD
jgi:hypothetical protein